MSSTQSILQLFKLFVTFVTFVLFSLSNVLLQPPDNRIWNPILFSLYVLITDFNRYLVDFLILQLVLEQESSNRLRNFIFVIICWFTLSYLTFSTFENIVLRVIFEIYWYCNSKLIIWIWIHIYLSFFLIWTNWWRIWSWIRWWNMQIYFRNITINVLIEWRVISLVSKKIYGVLLRKDHIKLILFKQCEGQHKLEIWHRIFQSNKLTIKDVFMNYEEPYHQLFITTSVDAKLHKIFGKLSKRNFKEMSTQRRFWWINACRSWLMSRRRRHNQSKLTMIALISWYTSVQGTMLFKLY